MAKTTKQLYEERTNNVGFADRKIQGHIKKGLDQYSQGLGVKLDGIHKEIDDLKEPLDRKILDLEEENKGLYRANYKFLALYRECLGEL